MKARGIVRVLRQSGVRNTARLRLFRIDESGQETLVVSSALVTKVAATAICRHFRGTFPARPDIEALEKIFRAPGKTAWASFTAGSAAAAAERACAQHRTSDAQGILAVITLSATNSIIDDMRIVLEVIHRHSGAAATVSAMVTYDECLSDQTRVEILLTGMPARAA